MQPTTIPPITPALIAESMTYAQYMSLAKQRFADKLTTSDDPHYNTEQILGFTNVNFARIRRLEKTVLLTESIKTALAAQQRTWVWLVLVESWCGDVAQTLPVMKHIADFSGKIELRLLLRDQHIDVIDAYRTNGGRSIPKLICLEADTLRELGTWGPRPQALQAEMDVWKTQNLPFEEVIERAHGWYAKDHTQHTQTELATQIRAWAGSPVDSRLPTE
ncbi:thioredoxin family protein [Fibrivirga algicola]|uniref:Thioredoxin family protein n=1 Tax=Fibrivirga algicola TaxID=2950420 RepID=A0ABX0QFE6_9BACT|nr:thioredoxin family protein [Fibrivirga algicola]NID10891.1 thioredoxin family protein [Fibrivirga algicola]